MKKSKRNKEKKLEETRRNKKKQDEEKEDKEWKNENCVKDGNEEDFERSNISGILFLMIVNFNNLKYLISFTTENGAEIC